jgi:2-phosphoglycerate kinase
MPPESSIQTPVSLVLVGGPSAVGKSRLAHALARRLDSTLAQIDDLQTAIETLVPVDRLPEYYEPATTYLRTGSPEEIAGAIEQVADFFAPAVMAAISNRVESGTSTVFEGDFISPDVAARAAGLGVRSVFLLAEEDEIRANLLHRDGEEQGIRATVSALHSERLRQRCRELGVPTVSARPFGTLLSRACGSLGIASS